MRVEFPQSIDFNQMLVFSVFLHLFILTFALFLPKPSLELKPIVPAFMVNVVEISSGEKASIKQRPAKNEQVVIKKSRPSINKSKTLLKQNKKSLVVKKAVQKALKHTKSGKGPYIIEAMTYRYRGHSMSDPAKYRSRDEVKKVRSESDPIVSFGEYLIEKNLTSETDLKEIDKEIKNIIADAALFAEQSPEPNPEELFTDIYIND